MSARRAFLRLLAGDLRYGLASAAPRLAFVAAASGLALFLSYVPVGVYLPDMEGPLSLGEALLCVWCGMVPYDPTVNQPFDFPMAWLALGVACLYAALDYPARDLGGMGARMIVAARSRWAWWLSKCAWAAACALACWLAGLAVCAAVTLATGGPWDLSVRAGVAAAMGAGQNDALVLAAQAASADGGASLTGAAGDVDLAAAVLAVPAALAAAVLLEAVVSLLWHPVVGFLAGVALLFLSAFFAQWWLVGDYLMLARTGALLDGGMDPAVGALLSLAACVVLVTAGGAAFCGKDLMGKGADAS